MFKWLKSLFEKQDGIEPPTVEIKSLEYQPQVLCKLHPTYSGATEPINNCNICWEIYNQKRPHWI